MIRAATARDAKDIAILWNWMIRETLATFTSVEKTDQEIATLIEQRKGMFVVAERDSTIVGFATCGTFRSGPGYAATREHTVIVSPQAHGRGFGRALLTAVEMIAKAQRVHVMIAAISSANPAAITFHEAMGYSETGRMPQVGRKADHWLDLVLMQKILVSDA